MKRLFAKAVLTGLIFSSASAPLQAVGWANPVAAQITWSQWFKNGFTSLKNSIYNASTETKILVGCAALATAGISYLIYRYLNPTDEELCAAAQPYIQKAQGYVALMPSIHPLDENLLNTIAYNLNQHHWEAASLSSSMGKSKRSLKAQQDILNRRIEKYEKASQYVPSALVDDLDTIVGLISYLSACIRILNTHGHYFRMMDIEIYLNSWSKAIAVKSDKTALLPIVRQIAHDERFPLLAFVQEIDVQMRVIESELRVALPSENGTSIYSRKRVNLRQLKFDLETMRATIASSREYAADQERKDAYDAEQRKLELERQRIAQEQERIRLEAERARIERERLQLEREKNQREREAHQAQHPNARRQVFHLDDECRIQ